MEIFCVPPVSMITVLSPTEPPHRAPPPPPLARRSPSRPAAPLPLSPPESRSSAQQPGPRKTGLSDGLLIGHPCNLPGGQQDGEERNPGCKGYSGESGPSQPIPAKVGLISSPRPPYSCLSYSREPQGGKECKPMVDLLREQHVTFDNEAYRA